MRILPLLAVLGAAPALAACIYVERERPAPPPAAVVTPAPGTTVVPPAGLPPVTVRPGYY